LRTIEKIEHIDVGNLIPSELAEGLLN